MQRLRRWRLMLPVFAVCVGVGVLAAGCADGGDAVTGPEHPPIPAFSMQPNQIAQCAQWSCSIEDCPNDPAQYGACCVQAVDAEHPNVQEKPSCDYPGYCTIYPNRCSSGPDCNPVPPPPECYQASAPPYCYADYCDVWN